MSEPEKILTRAEKVTQRLQLTFGVQNVEQNVAFGIPISMLRLRNRDQAYDFHNTAEVVLDRYWRADGRPNKKGRYLVRESEFIGISADWATEQFVIRQLMFHAKFYSNLFEATVAPGSVARLPLLVPKGFNPPTRPPSDDYRNRLNKGPSED